MLESLTSNYHINSNVTNIDQAEIICLGECHITRSHRERNAAIIDSLYKPGDVILVESPSNINIEFNDQTGQTEYVKTRPISIKGWDDRTLDDKDIAEIFSRARKNSFVIVTTGCASVCLGKIYHSNIVITALAATILSIFCGAMFFRRTILQIINKKMPLRNRNMCKIIDQHLVSAIHKKVFVIAGTAHFEEGSKYGINNKKCIEETIEFLKKRKYIILTPKR